MFRIDHTLIDRDSAPYIIAECADAHHGSLDLAIAMVEAAVTAGADAVKFQHHLPDEEMLPNTAPSSNMDRPLYDWLNDNILTLDEHKKVAQHCSVRHITYLCTPFSYKAADEIAPLVPAFKVGSGEAGDLGFLEHLAKYKKPILASCGMCSKDEMDARAEKLRLLGVHHVLFHCVSEYPPKLDDLSLNVIRTMTASYSCPIGYSCHANTIYPAIAAQALGATVFEKHCTLNHSIPGPDAGVSISFDDLGRLVDALHGNFNAFSGEKKIHKREEEIRLWAFHSVVASDDIRAGEVIERDKLALKRPGTGIPANEIGGIVGRYASRHIPKNTMIEWSDIE